VFQLLYKNEIQNSFFTSSHIAFRTLPIREKYKKRFSNELKVQNLENISIISAVTFISYVIIRGIRIKVGKNVMFNDITIYINVFEA
jgi:hypothetical protein